MLTWAAERPFCEHLCGWRMGGWFPAETPFGSHCSRAFWSWPFCEFLYPKLLDTAAPSFQTKAKRLIGSSHPTQGNPLLPQGTLRRCDYAVIHPQVHPQGQHPQKAESRPPRCLQARAAISASCLSWWHLFHGRFNNSLKRDCE